MQTPHNDTPHPNVFHQTKVHPAYNPHESDTEEYLYFIDFKSISPTAPPPHPDTRPLSIIYPHLLFQPFAFTLPSPYSPSSSPFSRPLLCLSRLSHTCCPTSQLPLCRSKQTPRCLAPNVPRGTIRLSPIQYSSTEIHTPLFIFNRAIFYSHSSIPIHSYTSLIDTDTSLFPTLSHIFAYPSCFAPSTSTTSSPAITRSHPVLHNKPTLTFSRFIRPRTDPRLFHVEQNKSSPNSDCSITKDIYSESYRPLHNAARLTRCRTSESENPKPLSPLPYRPKQTNKTLMSAGETPGMREA